MPSGFRHMRLLPPPFRCLLALGLFLLMPWSGNATAADAPMAAEARDSAFDPAELDAWVAQVRERFEVPGVAVAVVQDGQVLLERGWGVR